jgi:asparagine synthase (glutamine-hydrolysing)
MLMANSVEGRFPFLDVHVAEFAAALPERLRLRDLEEKHLLRRAWRRSCRPRSARPKRPTARRSCAPSSDPARPPTCASCSPERVAAGRTAWRRDAVARSSPSAERYVDAGLGEGDEMALVGVLSTMLLHERLVDAPRLAPAAVATRAGARGPWSRALAPTRVPDCGRMPDRRA